MIDRAAARGPIDALRRVADEALRAAPGSGVPEGDLRWAAARRAVVAAATARLAAAGSEPAGELFAAAPDGATAAQRRALALVLPSVWPADCAPPTFAELGAAYPGLLAAATRKRAGAWFTPPALAVPTAARALAPWLLAGAEPRVCDPAVGSGAFLLACLDLLAAATGRRRAAIAADQLHGVDLDPTAASLACQALRAACGGDAPAVSAIERHVRCGDGLRAHRAGSFDVVVGNPPWETLQDERRERAAAGAARPRVAADWLRRTFVHQGRGKLYTYRLFVERAVQLLRAGGRLGLIVPASLWFDRDAAPLRDLLLTQCRWEWLFALENRERLFPIDSRYRFGPIIAQRGGRTAAVRVAFGQPAAAWSTPEPPHVRYRPLDMARLCPHGRTFVELGSPRDLELLRRMHDQGRPLLGARGACVWRQGDYNMTTDRPRFVERRAAERAGFLPRADGTWTRAGSAPLRALHQGAMLGGLHPNAGAFAGGSGRAVRWRTPQHGDRLEPQYLVPAAPRDPRSAPAAPARVALRALSNATNARTAVACLLADEPCGNSIGVLTPRGPTATPVADCAFVAGVLGSLAFDWALRRRLIGTNLNAFVLADTVVPAATPAAAAAIAARALRLCAILPAHARLWDGARAEGWLPRGWTQGSHAAREPGVRRRQFAELDAEVAAAFGLGVRDLAWMLRDCDHAAARLRQRSFARGLDPKGFWRVDRDLPPARRAPALALAALAPLSAQRAADA